MYCTKCGKLISDDSKFCEYCANPVIITKPINTTSNNSESYKNNANENINVNKEVFSQGKKKCTYKNRWFLWWQTDNYTLEEQVSNYYTLKITQSYRGISFLLIMVSCIATFIFAIFNIAGFNYYNLLDALALLILAIFILKGGKIPIVIAMLFWTFEKIYSIISAPESAIYSTLWWYFYMGIFYRAFKVEQYKQIYLLKATNNKNI